MNLFRFVTTAASLALLTGVANAQVPVAPEVATVAVAPAAAPAVVAKGDLVDTVKASGQFTTFVKALDATNLTSVLKTNKNLTVFAPTDVAFAALPAGELDRLMKPENAAELQSLIVYHVVNAPVDSAKMAGAKGPVKTVAGTELLLDGSSQPLKANSAVVVQADVRASNGILHVIDHVLSPSDPAIAAAKAESAAAAAEAASAPAI
jgi:uncharacterized surface protein with fasciclin (FAS1) repeats